MAKVLILMIILLVVFLLAITGLIVGLTVGLLNYKNDDIVCNSCNLKIENIDFIPYIPISLVGVKSTSYSFSKSINATVFNNSIKQLKIQLPNVQMVYIPTTLLNNQIFVLKNFNDFNSEVFADVVIGNGAFGCQTFGITTADAMPFVISDGKFVAVGAISHSNCRMATKLIDVIKANFTNNRLDNLKVYLGPSSRSPNYYVGESIYNNYTQNEKDKYFKKINPNELDYNGNVIIHKKDAFDGLPRYGFDFSVYFKDSLIGLGIKIENIKHDERDMKYSDIFSSVRAEYARVYNDNPNTTLTTTQINESVGRSLMLVGCN